MSDILTETRDAFFNAITLNQEQIEIHLAKMGLSIKDIPYRCHAVRKIGYPLTTTYFFDGIPILETKLILDGYKITAEIKTP